MFWDLGRGGGIIESLGQKEGLKFHIFKSCFQILRGKKSLYYLLPLFLGFWKPTAWEMFSLKD